jgi:hypothetical protein
VTGRRVQVSAAWDRPLNQVRFRLGIVIVLMVATASVCAPAALADTSNSSNWAGYAAHRRGLSFRSVFASWTQPKATCAPGRETYSAYWVGLGGYNPTSNALEQTGTEIDCSPLGKVVSSAWYELVPAGSTPIQLTVRPGDRMQATVTVAGHRVTIALYDATRHRGFDKTLQSATTDVSSAEWIVEAPSECTSDTSCQTLPLADFAPTTFSSSGAESTSGHRGPISDPAWRATKITLSPGGARFAVYNGGGPSAGAASPSGLLMKGTSFNVTYSRVSIAGNPLFSADRLAQRSGHLAHPGRSMHAGHLVHPGALVHAGH